MREVKRLDSISRSPVYSSLGEALAGLPTIRAYRCEQRLALRNADLVDGSVIMSLVNMSMNRRGHLLALLAHARRVPNNLTTATVVFARYTRLCQCCISAAEGTTPSQTLARCAKRTWVQNADATIHSCAAGG